MKIKAQTKSQIHQASQDSGRASAQRKPAGGFGSSPRVLQQKALLDGFSGRAAQRFTEEEEKPLQGRFNGPVAQRAGGPEEELPLQGRFNGPVAQRAGGPEEELPLQGRFNGPVAQRAGGPEEELPLQGRFNGPVAQREDSDSDAVPEREYAPEAEPATAPSPFSTRPKP